MGLRIPTGHPESLKESVRSAPKWEWNKGNTYEQSKVHEGKPVRSQPYTKDYRQPREATEGEVVFPRKETTTGHPMPNGQL